MMVILEVSGVNSVIGIVTIAGLRWSLLLLTEQLSE